jgi:hypothetical protein
MPPCARCPKVLGRSCCEPGPQDRLTSLTHSDVARIAAHTGRGARSFTEEEWLTEAEAFDYETRRPIFVGYFRASTRRLTLARRDGACALHQAGVGCTLPEDVRPLACRLYPFEPWPDGTLALVPERHGDLDRARAEGGGCLAVEEAEDLDGLLAAFGLTARAVRALAARLVEEVKAHARADAQQAGRRSRGP